MGNLFAVAGSESLYLKWGKSVKVLQIQRQLVDMNVIFRPQLNNVHAIFMPPPPQLRRSSGGILIWSCPPVRYDFLRTRYLKNRLTYGVDIWYTVSLPYENVLINFKAECMKYCQRYSPFMSRHKKWRGIMLYPPNFSVSVRPSVRQRLNIRVRSITLIPFEIISRNLAQI